MRRQEFLWHPDPTDPVNTSPSSLPLTSLEQPASTSLSTSTSLTSLIDLRSHPMDQTQRTIRTGLPPPISSAGSSSLIDLRPSETDSSMSRTVSFSSTPVRTPLQQPRSDSHHHLLFRSEENCPSHLTGARRTRWLKAGEKAKRNQQLLANIPHFHWPTSHYNTPIHVHHQTPFNILASARHQIESVRYFTIDTESDMPSRSRPTPIPALLQIQAIHDASRATIFLLEVQHLPSPSSSLFASIQELCQFIFSLNHNIIAWGDVRVELQPFLQFRLFDLSELEPTINLQSIFTTHWNQQHPHQPECLAQLPNKNNLINSPDYLICLVAADDLDNDYHTASPHDDFSSCVCPPNVRPYKSEQALWSLQKAIHLTFNQALNKEMTLNQWSCGLDENLNTWREQSDIITRQAMITYAINDVFAPTHLFFHLGLFTSSPPVTRAHTTNSTTSTYQPQVIPLSFFILADSHAKKIPSMQSTPNFTVTTRAISGLAWINEQNPDLCARSHLSSSSFSSILSNTDAIMFLIGTNSVRTTHATRIIDQITEVITVLRTNHPHVVRSNSIVVALTFPCCRPSHTFLTESSLSSNINDYNDQLQLLSTRLSFVLLDFHADTSHLNDDGMHLRPIHQHLIHDSIFHHFSHFTPHRIVTVSAIPKTSTPSSPIPTSATKPPQSQSRSREALDRRNKKRHEKMKRKQQSHSIQRRIHPGWTLQAIKQCLDHHSVRYGGIPPTHRNILDI